MKIAYGPPGAVGVKSLQYVSGSTDDADYVSTNLHLVAKPVSAIALGTAVYAWAARRPTLRRGALAVSLGALAVQLLTRPK